MRLSASRKASLAQAARAYHRSVDGAAAYLTGRGITREIADMFLLGYVETPQVGDEPYIGRLAIPYLTPTGPVDIRYRSIDTDSGPKYLGYSGVETGMFNAQASLTGSSYIAVCEGELDTIIMQGACGVPAVGIPGANSWKPHYPLLLQDFEQVFVMCDGDEAGRRFGSTLAREVENVVVIHLPDNSDVNSVYVSEGREGVRRRLGL